MLALVGSAWNAWNDPTPALAPASDSSAPLPAPPAPPRTAAPLALLALVALMALTSRRGEYMPMRRVGHAIRTNGHWYSLPNGFGDRPGHAINPGHATQEEGGGLVHEVQIAAKKNKFGI